MNGQWIPDGCLITAEAHDRQAKQLRERGEERLAVFCEAWAQWYRDRAAGKPGEDVTPEMPS